MDFKVYRNNQHVSNAYTKPNSRGQWEPLEHNEVMPRDVLESTEDGKRYEVVENNPTGYTRAGLYLRPLV